MAARLIATVLTAGLLAFSVACASATSTPTLPRVGPLANTTPGQTVSPGARPEVLVTYSPSMSLTPTGANTSLVVTLTIHNTGYASFNTDPANLKAVVQNVPYTYNPAATDAEGGALKAIELADGATETGKLVFVLPPGASSSKVGYTMAYAGPQQVNVRFALAAPPLATPGGTSVLRPTIQITYTPTIAQDPGSGRATLAVNLTITNNGYDSFVATPASIEAVVESVPYRYDPTATAATGNALRDVDLANGASTSGTLVFFLPPGAAQGGAGYTLQYTGLQLYNIQWTKR